MNAKNLQIIYLNSFTDSNYENDFSFSEMRRQGPDDAI